MKLAPFKLERYFEKYEFVAPYLLSCSDCEPLSMVELLSWGDPLVLDLWETLNLGYTETRGHPLLRREIAGLYPGVEENQVMVCAPGEGIFLVMNSLLREGDHVITMFPAYQSLYEVASGLGCRVEKWQAAGGDSWVFNPQDLETLINKDTRLIILNLPHNPTGAMLSREEFKKILTIAKERGIFVFCDEMYRYLELDEGIRLPSAVEVYDDAVSLCGLSKSFGLPGLRIGWLVTKNRTILDRLASFKDYTTICSSAPSEILAIGALRSRQRIIERNMGIIRGNIALLRKFLDKYSDILSWIPPQAGSLALCRLHAAMGTPEFCEAALEKQGVLLVPGQLMDVGGNFLRIGFGRKNMPEALARLEVYVRDFVN